MFNMVMNALAKGCFRAFIFFCIWFLGYLFWRLIGRNKKEAIRPLWLDILIVAGFSGLIGALAGIRYHQLDMIVATIFFVIGVWIVRRSWKKRKLNISNQDRIVSQQLNNPHMTNPFRRTETDYRD